MALVRWSPLEEMSVLRDQINRIFEPVALDRDNRRLNHALPVEVTETPNHYSVRLLVPGIAPDKIVVQATSKELTVSYDSDPRQLGEQETVHINQLTYGKFSKKLSFPENIESEGIQAQYEYGILTVTLPKVERMQCKPIEIKVSN